MERLAQTPEPPYYAVVFTSLRTERDGPGYEEMSDRMVELAARQPGFLGIDSARGADGVGITVSYWDSLESIRAWRAHAEHRMAQTLGRENGTPPFACTSAAWRAPTALPPKSDGAKPVSFISFITARN